MNSQTFLKELEQPRLSSKILRLAMDSQQISQSYIYINKRITTKKT